MAARIELPVWAYEKIERLPDNSVPAPPEQKTIQVRLAFERDSRISNYPDTMSIVFVDEKAAGFFKIGQRYRLILEPV